MASSTAQHIQPTSIAIIGSGSLACLYAARLHRLADVQLIGSWREQIDAINAHGVRVRELDGSLSATPVRALLHGAARSTAARVDYAIVLVKSYQTRAAAERITAHLDRDCTILTLQNGLGNVETLRERLPGQLVAAGVTMQGANADGLARVNHAGNGDAIIDRHPRLQPLQQLLNAAGLATQTFDQIGASSIDYVLWRKLIINSVINPLTALLDQPNGYIGQAADAKILCRATALETAGIAALEGAWTASQVADAEALCLDAASATAANRSSMLQDVARGNKTEIDAISGEIVRRARRHGRDAPLNRLWCSLIEAAASERKIHTTDALLSLAKSTAALN